MDKLNCPNCGAPIRSVECPYCGTMFYDFASIHDDKASYLRIMHHDQVIITKARMDCATIEMRIDELPKINVEFTVYPDDRGILIARHELKGDV